VEKMMVFKKREMKEVKIKLSSKEDYHYPYYFFYLNETRWKKGTKRH
jgi:hypothetical protein